MEAIEEASRDDDEEQETDTTNQEDEEMDVDVDFAAEEPEDDLFESADGENDSTWCICGVKRLMIWFNVPQRRMVWERSGITLNASD